MLISFDQFLKINIVSPFCRLLLMHVDVVEGDTNIWYQVVDDDNKYFLKQTYICTLRKVYIYIHTQTYLQILTLIKPGIFTYFF